MVMANSIIEEYETEFENFNQKVTMNFKVLQKIFNNNYQEFSENGQRERDFASKIKDDSSEIAKKIENAQEDVNAVRTDKHRAEKEKLQLKQDYEQLSMLISEKIHERDGVKEVLAQTERRLEEKKQQVELDERRHKEKISNIEQGLLHYQTHLGLKIQRTRHNTLVFIFTQIDRTNPEKEHFLELTLEENVYHLISSNPPLPNLRELEERLNASNNLSGCFVHVRKLFQKMGE